MALHIQLVSDLGVILDLDAFPYGVQPNGASLGSVDLSRQYSNVWQRGFRPLVSENVGNREMEFSVQLRGTGHDDLINNQRQLGWCLSQAALWHVSGGRHGAAAYLAVQLPSATVPTVFDIIAGGVVEVPTYMHSVIPSGTPYVLDVPIKLTCKPWGRSQLLNRVSTVVNFDGGLSSTVLPNTQLLSITPSSAMTRESPMRLTFQHTSGASGDSYAGGVMVARRSYGNVANWTPYVQAEFGNASNYAVTSGTMTSCTIKTTTTGIAQGGVVAVLTNAVLTNAVSGVWNTVTFNRNVGDMAGRHRVYGNFCGTGQRISSMQLTYGGVSGDAQSVDSATYTAVAGVGNFVRNYLGIIEIPDDPQTAAFKYQLHVKLTSGAAHVHRLDSYVLFPIDEQVYGASISGGAAIWASQQLRLDGLDGQFTPGFMNSSGDMVTSGAVYANNQPPYGFTMPPRPTKFMALLASGGSTKGLTMIADYYTMTEWLL